MNRARTRARETCACACALSTLLLLSPARANPLDAFGFGARAPAMGSAYLAVADDAAAGYYNPAGLARGADLRLDAGYQAAVPALRLNGVQQPVEPTRGLAAGLVVPGNLLGLRLAFGVTLFLPDQDLTRLRVLPYDQPRFVLYDNATQRFYLAANLAIHVYRGLYLGGGLTFMSHTSGLVSLKGTIALGNPDESMLYTQANVDLVAVRYPQAGLLWQVNRWLALGATYRHSFVLDVQQGVAIKADVGNPGQPPAVPGASLVEQTHSVDLFQPWQLAAGAALRLPFAERVLVALDLTFARYSEMPVPAATFNLMLDIGKLNSLVHLRPPRSYPDPRFHDILIPALGAEWRVADGLWRDRVAVDLRGGYRYEPSPVPQQDGEATLADGDKHTISAGAGIELRRLSRVLPKPLAVDVYCAFLIMQERTFLKSDPRSVVGDFTAGGVIYQVGGQLRWRL